MTVNPFDDENGTFSVLVNEEGQHSLWPAFAAVPGGWTVTLADTDRATCLAHIEREWTDLRPRSLRDALAAEAQA